MIRVYAAATHPVFSGAAYENLAARTEGTEAAERQREAIRKAIAFKKYEFDAHGVEMNQRYRSSAVVTDGQIEPAFALDADLHYQPTTWPWSLIPCTVVPFVPSGLSIVVTTPFCRT